MNELQYKMKAKSRYQPSKTVEALFTTAVVKIKANADKAVAKQKAMSETEVVSAKDEVEAKAKEPILEQKVEPETESFDQTGTNETKSEAEPVSREETTGNFDSEAEQEVGAVEQKAEDADTAFEDIAEEKVEPEVETEAAIESSEITPETESFEQTGTNEMKLEAEPVSRKETTGTFESETEQEVGAVEQKAEDADTAFEDVAEEKVEPEVETEAAIESSAIKPETDSFDQTGTNETKSEAEPVSRKETTETFESEARQEVGAIEQKAEDADTAFEDVAEEKVEPEVEAEAAIESSAIKPETESVEQTGTNETKSEAEPETTGTFESKAEQEVGAVEQKVEDADTAFEDVAEEIVEIKAESQEPAAGEVSKSIQQMAQSQLNQPREQSLAGSGLCAKDVMLKELVWGSPEDSVQQAITKMQRYGSGYLMVGIDGVLEGIVSNSNITGALSPYLRPVFAKWRRPMDDATLQIRIKWIMSKPVHIVKPETHLPNVMENMCRFGLLCLPVVDKQGKVQGLVTEADIFKVLLGLKSSPNTSTSGNEYKEQSTSDHREIESTPAMEPDLATPV
jgi:predicted transcriptional regulator